MSYQEKYWRELDQLKVHILYLEIYKENTVQIDRFVNIFSAIASSVSIAMWIVLREYSLIWASIIMGSQVLNAIKLYLPYSKRLKQLYYITNNLETLFLSMENSWFDVSEGMLTNEEIHKLHISYKNKKIQITQKYIGSSIIPENSKMLKKAKKDAKIYFDNFYTF